MYKKTRCTSKTVKRLLNLLLAVWFAFSAMMIPDVHAAQTDIVLEHILPDGMIIRLTAPPSAFPACSAEMLFLEVHAEEQTPDSANALSALLGTMAENASARAFDIRVMQRVPEQTAVSCAYDESALPETVFSYGESIAAPSDESIAAPCDENLLPETVLSYGESIAAPSDENVPTAVEIQPQGDVTVTFILPEAARTDAEIKVYHMDEQGGAPQDMGAQIGENGEIKMQTNHFSRFVLLASAPQNNAALTAVTLTMDWVGGNEQTRPADVTVRLYAGYVEVPQSAAVLNAAAQWTHTWKNLPAKDNFGNPILYTISQDALPNTTPEMQYLNTIDSVWVPTDALSNGDCFVLADGANDAMTFDAQNTQNIQAVRVAFTNVLINGVNTRVIDAPSLASRWTAIKNSAVPQAFYLKNGSNVYLCQHKDTSNLPTNLGTAVGADTQNQTLFTYTNTKTLASNANTWAMRYGNRYTYTTGAEQASALTLYRQCPVDRKIHITNRYTPPIPSSEGKVSYHKRIDFLGDGVQNPDTALSGKDDYRLYLDVASSIEMPADLVLVLDVSGSMGVEQMKILNNVLMGTNGFMARFLNAHASNHLSIVYFWGARMPNWACGLRWAEDNPLLYGKIQANQDVGDATIYQGWMTAAGLSSLPAPLLKGVGGTNYGAGLYQAQRLLNKPPDNPAATKYMVFMSDGVPTHALSTKPRGSITNTHDVNMVFGLGNEYVPKNLHSAATIGRYGSGEGDVFNTSFCRQANKELVKNFSASNPDLNIFSIGIGDADAEVLQNLASGSGRYLNAANFEDLDATFASILGPRNVVITDTLSDYVNLAATNQLQIKLTARSGETEKILWNNQAVTAAGSGIVQSVTVDAASKKVTATFVPEFTLSPNTVYTLSFNVQTAPKAYTDYAAHGYTAQGEADTDYATNKTSSARPGFYSDNNAKATLSYQFGTFGTAVTRFYQKPVVQVRADEITLSLLKTDDTAQQTPLADAEFQLFRAVYNSATRLWEKSPLLLGTIITNMDGKGTFARKLSPGHYFLVETKAPPNCQPLQSDILIELDGEHGTAVQGKATLTSSALGFWQVHVTNTRRITLPATGDSGTLLFGICGSGCILTAAILLAYALHRRREGDELF
ncbi:MAG: Cna B-type domain-containing protein [Ruthenibacterium sp.]